MEKCKSHLEDQKKGFLFYLFMTGIMWIFGNLLSGAMKAGGQASGSPALCNYAGCLWGRDHVCDRIWNRCILRI